MVIENVNLKRQYKSIKSEIDDAIYSVVQSQHFSLGPALADFEIQFADYIGSKYVVGVDNGSDALIFTLLALGIGKGDEVITPVNSFTSTTFAITEVGATPVFVDVNRDTHQISVEAVKSKITSNTKCILPVHLYGSPCEIDKIKSITDQHGIALVEDAAQAHGSYLHGKHLGTYGKMGVFSFYPGKNLGAYGNGGAICTDDEKLYHKLRLLRNFGQEERYFHKEFGYNSKLDDIQAAVLTVKLHHLNEWNSKRRSIAKLYDAALTNIVKPRILDGALPNRHLYVIESDSRNKLLAHLNKKGIQALIHYPLNIHLQECYKHLGHKVGDFPNAEDISNRVLSLPIYAELKKTEVAFICAEVEAFNHESV